MIEFQTFWSTPCAFYLFLGGLSSGLFIVTAAIYFVYPNRFRNAIARAFVLSFLCLALGVALLCFELENPERVLNFPRAFSHLSSWMTFGAWGVGITLVLYALCALLSWVGLAGMMARVAPRLVLWRLPMRRVLVIAALPFALFVSFYTGMLLKSAENIPFWDSWLLPLLFVISAFVAGLNAFYLISMATGEARQNRPDESLFAARIIATGILAEMLVLVLFLFSSVWSASPNSSWTEGALSFANSSTQGGFSVSMFASQGAAVSSIDALLGGSIAPAFWILVIGTGVLVPLCCIAIYDVLRHRVDSLLLTSAIAGLIGECSLRFCILLAGAHADFFAAGLLQLMQ